jgi:hypothetical protein
VRNSTLPAKLAYPGLAQSPGILLAWRSAPSADRTSIRGPGVGITILIPVRGAMLRNHDPYKI